MSWRKGTDVKKEKEKLTMRKVKDAKEKKEKS